MKLKSRLIAHFSILNILFLVSLGVGHLNLVYAQRVNSSDVKAPIIASLVNFDSKMKSVTLDDQGKLTVVLHGQGDLITQYIDLNTTDHLAELSKSISQSEIVTDIHPILCMVVPDRNTLYSLGVGSYSLNADTFQNGPMKVVLTPSGCSVSTYTHPKDSNIKRNAILLKDALKNLATEALEEDEVGC